jgi:hypothetical protein
MRQRVIFDTTPTSNPDEAVDSSRNIVNASTGIGMDLLQQIIEDHIPIVDDEEVITIKEIIRTDRHECPCCDTSLIALVNVHCAGLYKPDEWKKVEDLYKIRILADRNSSQVTIDRLRKERIYKGRANLLPQKEYK